MKTDVVDCISGTVMVLVCAVGLEMVMDSAESVLLGVVGVVGIAVGFWDVETCGDGLGDGTRLLERCECLLSVPECSNEETAFLDVPACSLSRRFTAFISWVSGHPCTSFDIVHVVSEHTGTFCIRETHLSQCCIMYHNNASIMYH